MHLECPPDARRPTPDARRPTPDARRRRPTPTPKIMQATRDTKTGGPAQLKLVEMERPKPGSNEVLVRVEAVGVNFIDVYHRTGLYPSTFPYVPGSEGAGVVEEAGAGVKSLKRGDRVAWARVPGAYAQFAVVA